MPWAPWVLAGVVAGSVFTTIYSLRFLWGAFARKGLRGPSTRVPQLHPPPASFLFAPGGPGRRGPGVRPDAGPAGATCSTPYADSVPGGPDYHLALWHGWNLPLLLSVRCARGGHRVVHRRGPAAPRLRTGWLPLGNADRIYDATLRGLDFVAFKVTGATQRGSIPATQSVILLTLVGLPVAVLALGAP